MKNKKEDSNLKIMLLDIETAPNLGWVWGKWEQDVIEFKQETYILSFAFKWLGDKKTQCYSLNESKGYKRNPTDDTELVRRIYTKMCEADILIGHNIDSFDFKVLNVAFLRCGLTPPTPSKTIDTLKILRSKFKLNSNKLNDVGIVLKLGTKVETGGFKLWKGCMEGDKNAWAKMIKYNKNDVDLLEKVYLKIRPFITNHPRTDTDSTVCQKCHSNHIQQRGWTYTAKQKKKRMFCLECGSWTTAPKAELIIR